MLDGILIIDKPVGLTSHDVVYRLRKILKTKSIGHTGTLDPFATGVLVMLIGKATRLARFLDKDEKEYEALIKFGFRTDTGDLTGAKLPDSVKPPAEIKEILDITNWQSVLEHFKGEISQIPPMYSAKKIQGKKLYELARKGIEIEREPVNVLISKLETVEETNISENELRIRVACSAGTYIRTLAEDIGHSIGIGAHLTELRRIRAGIFSIDSAVSIEQLELINQSDQLSNIFISMNDAVSHLPEVLISEEEVRLTRNGMKYQFENAEIENDQAIRMVDENGNLCAVGFYKKVEKYVQPKVVLV